MSYLCNACRQLVLLRPLHPSLAREALVEDPACRVVCEREAQNANLIKAFLVQRVIGAMVRKPKDGRDLDMRTIIQWS